MRSSMSKKNFLDEKTEIIFLHFGKCIALCVQALGIMFMVSSQIHKQPAHLKIHKFSHADMRVLLCLVPFFNRKH